MKKLIVLFMVLGVLIVSCESMSRVYEDLFVGVTTIDGVRYSDGISLEDDYIDEVLFLAGAMVNNNSITGILGEDSIIETADFGNVPFKKGTEVYIKNGQVYKGTVAYDAEVDIGYLIKGGSEISVDEILTTKKGEIYAIEEAIVNYATIIGTEEYGAFIGEILYERDSSATRFSFLTDGMSKSDPLSLVAGKSAIVWENGSFSTDYHYYNVLAEEDIVGVFGNAERVFSAGTYFSMSFDFDGNLIRIIPNNNIELDKAWFKNLGIENIVLLSGKDILFDQNINIESCTPAGDVVINNILYKSGYPLRFSQFTGGVLEGTLSESIIIDGVVLQSGTIITHNHEGDVTGGYLGADLRIGDNNYRSAGSWYSFNEIF